MQQTARLTRADGLARLERFAPRLGRAYTDTRNTDRGPSAEPTTTALSPHLRRKLLTEQEVVEAALFAHGSTAAEKFVQEVVWRSYFKGHLETRPGIWADYRRGVVAGHERLERESGLRKAYGQAVAGGTGIDGFDDWSRDLVEFGWLHNHARMWFASIWIFTLRLPWELGADFFMRHLLDGDPASNTLSWRWVAGLHTRGKHYLARADNIRRHTDGRFDPKGLEEVADPLDEPASRPVSKLAPADPSPRGDVALLIHLDDLHPESLPLDGARVVRVGGLLAHADGAADPVIEADRTAMADALARAAAHFQCPADIADEDFAAGAPVVAPWAPVGPSADALPSVARLRRPWDEAIWPRSTRGYFQVKAAIPEILAACDVPIR
ncbi:FAD-binding domain-containing protein [Methylobacterium sp. Leaf466]|uniref:FAD-binding domain-containing protein n=1 Tax=Methylobacterium sp. Leaf466 TaxID=1736386 RepID=UPI0006FE7BA7|nr:FAD-binding domain-containing protein [Methylobacterium sp. Leaf466]KQT84392.1 deoxyribodipyrimidine photolyase [Methylobacterium sp. Leaf466]